MTDVDLDLEPVPVQLSKKRRLGDILIEELPNADQYETSFMHRDVLVFVFVTKTDFIITCSVDGHVKFWKKLPQGIEFVKHYKAHTETIRNANVSYDGLSFASCSPDKSIKVFDVVNFDMINMFRLDYEPNEICWISIKSAMALVACSNRNSPIVNIYDGRGAGFLYSIQIHSSPVHLMRFNPLANCVISVDEKGMLEYWTPKPNDFTEEHQGKGYEAPDEVFVSWKLKSDTDLYEFKKNRTTPSSLEFSKNFDKFSTFDWKTRQVRIFSFKTGKLLRTIDESIESIEKQHKEGYNLNKIDDMEFGRRLTIEKEIGNASCNILFDESGKFVIYTTLWGIKVVGIKTGQVKMLVGKSENLRFLHIALYQGAPRKKTMLSVEMAASDNSVIKEAEETDPTLICTAFKKNRFYIFSRREPDTESSTSRDIYNEKPTKEEQVIASHSKVQLSTTCVIHTEFGDIYCRLFPEFAPKAVENFISLAKQGYYDNNKWHRCIKGFMIQTGDPMGDGTGGQSCWGLDFEDEFNEALKHDRPYTISMANSGPNTNGSQFFITTAPTSWLDNKHTIFGRATGGMDVIHRIEHLKTDKHDRPEEPLRIITVEIR